MLLELNQLFIILIIPNHSNMDNQKVQEDKKEYWNHSAILIGIIGLKIS